MSDPLATGTNSTLLLQGGSILDESGTVQLRDLWIQDGHITQVSAPGTGSPVGAEADTVIDASDCLVLPGFVNMHTHSYGPLCRQDAPNLPLEPWMMHAWARTGGRSVEEVELSATLQAIEAIRTGTTGLLDQLGGDVASTRAALVAYERIGIRARLAPMISDVRLPDSVGLAVTDWPAGAAVDNAAFDHPTARELMDATLGLHESWHSESGRTSVMLGPSAPQRCTPELWTLVAEAAEGLGLRVHTHLLESRLQAGLPVPPPHDSWAGFLDSFGLLTERLSAAHAVWLTPTDLERVAATGTVLVHNPQSNLQLGSGIADVTGWRRAGVHVALGTDGANCGGSMDMVSSMRFAAVMHRPMQSDPARWETPRSVLALATSAGSTALGFGTGRLEVGAPADISVFQMTSSAYADDSDPVASFLLSSWDHSARTVLIGGVPVLLDGTFCTIDEQEVLAQARQVRLGIAERNAGYIALADRQVQTLTNAVRRAEPPRPLAIFHRD